MNICETKRLRLCRLSAANAPFILRLVNTPSWLEFIGDRGVRTLTDARRYIVNGSLTDYERLGFGMYLVKRRTDDIPIGLCGLLKRESLADVDIGFAFLPEYTGQGYAFEAASAVMHYSRETLGLARILAITTTDNVRSQNLLTRLGLHFQRMVLLPDNPKELMLFASDGKTPSEAHS
jgi:RimJ/RimL family protein N-acetyltransferase